jgi:hypothetical protein
MGRGRYSARRAEANIDTARGARTKSATRRQTCAPQKRCDARVPAFVRVAAARNLWQPAAVGGGRLTCRKTRAETDLTVRLKPVLRSSPLARPSESYACLYRGFRRCSCRGTRTPLKEATTSRSQNGTECDGGCRIAPQGRAPSPGDAGRPIRPWEVLRSALSLRALPVGARVPKVPTAWRLCAGSNARRDELGSQ